MDEHDLFRATASTPSSSRTVLPPHIPLSAQTTRTATIYDHDPRLSMVPGTSTSTNTTTGMTPTNATMYMQHPLPTDPRSGGSHSLSHSHSRAHSHVHGSPQSQSRHSLTRTHAQHAIPPVPPARTSSLPVLPPSPDTAGRVPSVQVIQPTPTKRKGRRRSLGATSIASSEKSRSTLEVSVEEKAEAARGGIEEEDSEEERARAEESRKARAREMGRHRQRRKRERDKKAKESARGSSSHLPIPSRNPSQTNLPALTSSHPLTIAVPPSAPSSVSSTYSSLPSLPLTNGYYSLSPSQPYSMSSTSLSGTSSPSVLFSPAISTPGIGYSETVWSTEGSTSNLDLNAARPKPKTRPRGRTASGISVRRPSQTDMAPVLAPIVDAKNPTHRPEKRRKSQPEDFREVGLGVTIGDGMNSWPQLSTESQSQARPKPRRTASDLALPTAEWPLRSPTPPPVPSLPAEFRRPTTASTSAPMPSPSSQGSFFAGSVILALQAEANGQINQVLQSRLGLGKAELESMHADLAAMYDRWRLEKGMSLVSLDEEKIVSPISEAESSAMAVGYTQSSETTLTSPTTAPTSQDSFVTPSNPRVRPHPAALAPPESPTTESSTAHARNRSLSSTSLMSRGLVINSQVAQGATAAQAVPPPIAPQRWESPVVAHKGSDSPTTSSLQTPSTGQGGFQIPSLNAAPVTHWRSATDPTHLRFHPAPVGWHDVHMQPDPPGLESPLAMTHTSKGTTQMGPPPPRIEQPAFGPAHAGHPIPSQVPLHAQAQVQAQQMQPIPAQVSHMPVQAPMHPQYAAVPYTPTSRAAMRHAIPFTPPTPMPLKGGNAPMWYHPSFAAMPSGTAGQMMSAHAQGTPGQVIAMHAQGSHEGILRGPDGQEMMHGGVGMDPGAALGQGQGQGHAQQQMHAQALAHPISPAEAQAIADADAGVFGYGYGGVYNRG